ncbi:MAG TPA: Nif3-like dinuclear metal center hexameric protein [Sutterella sp.]|nr:Nif3-like dinuclear metal center hexameric protein [Sutterella sp.]
MQISQILSYTDSLLHPSEYKDYAPNGLQIQGDGRAIRKIALAVTASLAAEKEAVRIGADALFVHHGWFWKHEDARIVGIRYNRIKTLLLSGMALVAYHLPLDNQPDFGNNALFGKALGFAATGRFGQDDLGWTGLTNRELSAPSLAETITQALGREPLIVGPTDRPIRRVAWCTGAAQDYLEEAAACGVDAYLSGEISERTTHVAREVGIPYFACGHHATERFGVKALGRKLTEHFGIETTYIEIDNPV